ncbi:MAG: HAMP domain-containing protein [Leptospirales bacterium]|nr:HAMP domain-containing protein [Leptospirales bacterium]
MQAGAFLRELIRGEEEGDVGGASLSVWTLRAKLMVMITAVIALALVLMIILTNYFSQRDGRIRVEEANTRVTQTSAASVSTILESTQTAARIAAEGLAHSPNARAAVARTLFGADSNWLYFGTYRKSAGGLIAGENLSNSAFLSASELSAQDLQAAVLGRQRELARVSASGSAMVNLSPALRRPVAALSFTNEHGNETLVVLLKMEAFLEAFQSRGIAVTFLVSDDGVAIAHPDRRVALAATNMAEEPAVKAMRESQIDNGLGRFRGLDQNFYLASFQRLPFGGGVITQVAEDSAFEEIYSIRRRNIYLMLMIVAAAVLVIYFFARSISRPVKRLTRAAGMIEAGNYELQLQPETRDEIGTLTQSFNSMARGLRERENLKTSFGRFVNKELAELSLSGQLRAGGERKDCAIFFSDIRGFTGISEKLRPEEVVEMLNGYFSEMVACVNANHGVVDKFMGDAIMAVWGALRQQGNPVENAFNAALMMRQRLRQFNQRRGSARKPILRIGAGINAGSVIAGQIGSDQKMEYTVIGDAVNTASRVEGLSKVHKLDILVTQEALDRVRGMYRTELVDETQVKGRNKPVRIYALLGKIGDADAPESTSELRKLLGIEAPRGSKKR